jgi:hypothetical protein
MINVLIIASQIKKLTKAQFCQSRPAAAIAIAHREIIVRTRHTD